MIVWFILSIQAAFYQLCYLAHCLVKGQSNAAVGAAIALGLSCAICILLLTALI